MVYQGCWFLFQQYCFELPTLNPFLGKFGLEKSKLFVLPENWHTRTYTHSISKMLIHISILVFSNFKRKSWGCWSYSEIFLFLFSYFFIVDKSKKLNQSTKECWINEIIVAIKIFLIKKALLQPKLWNKIKTT